MFTKGLLSLKDSLVLIILIGSLFPFSKMVVEFKEWREQNEKIVASALKRSPAPLPQIITVDIRGNKPGIH